MPHYYFTTTGDWSLIKELSPKLCEVIQWHVQGTDYGIKMDASDGLLQAGVPGLQLTWLDAKVGDWVVTPRSCNRLRNNSGQRVWERLANWLNQNRHLLMVAVSHRPGVWPRFYVAGYWYVILAVDSSSSNEIDLD